MDNARKPRQKPRGLGRRERRSYHHGDLRNAALAEAVKHINLMRDTAFTLRELATRLGVSSTALYRHFDSKTALLEAVAEEGFRQILRRFDADEHLKEAHPYELMAARGLAYVQFAAAYPAHFRTMFLPELRDRGAHPVLWALRRELYGKLEAALENLRAHDMLTDADIGDIGLTSWATVHGLATLLVGGQVRVDPGTDEEDMRALIRRVLDVQAEGFLRDGIPQPAAKAQERCRSAGRGDNEK